MTRKFLSVAILLLVLGAAHSFAPPRPVAPSRVKTRNGVKIMMSEESSESATTPAEEKKAPPTSGTFYDDEVRSIRKSYADRDY